METSLGLMYLMLVYFYKIFRKDYQKLRKLHVKYIL